MKNVIISSIVMVALLATSCKNQEKKNAQSDDEVKATSSSVKPLLAQASNEASFEPKVFYVTASSGLSLRAGSNLNSKKILTLPYGAQVQFLSSPKDTEMVVAGVAGKMLEISYQGAQGYAFDGYLSSLAPPQINEDIVDYARRIGTQNKPVVVLKTPNKKGENYGLTTSIELPAKSWNEAYTISRQLFMIPNSLKLNLDSKRIPTRLENNNKRARTLVDELVISKNDADKMQAITYTYALKDYSRKVTLTKTLNGFKAVEVEESF